MVPVSGSDLGKNSLLKTSAAAAPYRKKAYLLIVVPIRLATITRRSSPARRVGGAASSPFMNFPPKDRAESLQPARVQVCVWHRNEATQPVRRNCPSGAIRILAV